MSRDFEAGKAVGIVAERARVRAIVTLPEAEFVPELAANLALASDLSVSAVQQILQRSTQIRSAAPSRPAVSSRTKKAAK